jgi:hypothetical protein
VKFRVLVRKLKGLKALLAIAILSISIALIVFFNSKGSVSLEGLEARVYKTPTCTCCDLHVSYLRSYGIDVEIVEVTEISGVKDSLGIPRELSSCHTTVIKDYFIEGHVPVEAISKLVKERPDIKGIALPGMPSGSPGMPGAKKERFVVFAVDRDGSYHEFMVI